MISVLIPTRKRPESLKQTIESARATATSRVEFVCYVDNDDLETYECTKGFDVKIVWGPRITLSDTWNACARHADGDIFLQGNDDIRFRTPGWDQMVEEAFAASDSKVLMVHGSDGSGVTKNFGPHPFVHRVWYETLGYFTPPHFSSDWGDTWINDLANALNCRRELPFTIEHLHVLFGKAGFDQTTIDRLVRDRDDRISRLYAATLPLRNRDVEKLRRKMSGWTAVIQLYWQILILSQPSRAFLLGRVLKSLHDQIGNHVGVEVCLRIFDRNMSLGDNRQAMINAAKAEYVNFVDDDDMVSKDYVNRITLHLGGVDQVGFQVQCYIDGIAQKPTYHSLRYGKWSEDDGGYYRDISHLNPMRLALVKQVSMEGGFGEDSRWADRMRALGIVKTENYVDSILYHYYYRSKKMDSARGA